MTKTKLMRDAITSLLLMLFSLLLLLWLIPNYVAMSQMTGMSPRFFPNFGALLLGGFSFILFIQTLIAVRKASQAQPSMTQIEQAHLNKAASDKAPQTTNNNALSGVLPLGVLLSLLVFILSFKWVGYLLAAPLMMLLLCLIFGGRNPLKVLFTALAAAGIIFLIFNYVLKVPLL